MRPPSRSMVVGAAAGAVVGAAVGAAVGVAHLLARRRVERAVASRLPCGPAGIVRGAEPIDLPARAGGRGRGALLLHGFGDTPQSLAELAAALHAAGWAVRVPLLPGHGRTLRRFRAARAEHWLGAARGEWRTFRARHPDAVLVGQSMGGALAAVVAAESGDVPALVLLAPYLAAGPALRRLARVPWMVDALCPYVPSAGARSIHDPAARDAVLSYGALTGRLARELHRVVVEARRALPAVAAPTLVIHARADNRIAPPAAEAAYRILGASRKALVWLDRCGHVVSVDYEKSRVFALTAAWLDAHAPAPATPLAPAAP